MIAAVRNGADSVAAIRAALGSSAADVRASVQRLRWKGIMETGRIALSGVTAEWGQASGPSYVRGGEPVSGVRPDSPSGPERGRVRSRAAAAPITATKPGRAHMPALAADLSAAVTRAAKIQGGGLERFTATLIGMGLECWRDDRELPAGWERDNVE